jgi:rod shape-determining protein MreD
MIRLPVFRRAYAEEILLPVRPGYVALTLFVAFMLNLLPLSGVVLALRPDFVALVLLYWGIEHPRQVGFLPAFLLGLAVDVADGSLFGQHALAYSGLMYAAIAVHRRVPLFSARDQMLHVFGILLATQMVVLLVRRAAGSEFPGWWYFLASVTGAIIWPAARQLLRTPLRPRAREEHI